MDIWNQLNQTYHPDMNIQLFNAGRFPFYSWVTGAAPQAVPAGSGPAVFQQLVVNPQPTIVVVWMSVDYILVNHGITTVGDLDMAAFGQDMQQLVDQIRQIPSVRQIVLVTPLCAGERRYGQNPQDGRMDQLIAVIRQTSINNGCPVIDMTSMMRSADWKYNAANAPYGVLTGDGIHPVLPNWANQATSQMIAGTFYKAFGE
jgi:hypothetical protein